MFKERQLSESDKSDELRLNTHGSTTRLCTLNKKLPFKFQFRYAVEKTAASTYQMASNNPIRISLRKK